MFNIKSMILLVGLLMLNGCAVPPALTPVSQIEDVQSHQQQPSKPVTRQRATQKMPKVVEYRCQKNQKVRVQPNSNQKSKAIQVTFNQTSHKLSSAVTKIGKKYSNIRWIWREDFNGRGQLSDNRGKILADNCIRQ
ncbi:hypothetical protein A4G19_03210 [Pasteurellaceae bacterium Macca]|nr:hypothetical protein [Pasteurellaceae bacterium Macca]